MKLKFWERSKGFFERFRATLPKKDRADWTRFNFREYSERFDDYYNSYPKIKSQVLTIAGQVVAEGLFLNSAGDYPRAEEAMERCERLNERVGMDQLVYETAIRLAKYGTAFMEIDFNSVNGLDLQMVPLQKYMSPVWNEQTGLVDRWQYVIHSVARAEWRLPQLAVFAWNVGGYPPFGTSLLTGIDRELETVDEIVKNLKAYLEKQAFASNVLQVGDGQYMPNESEVQSIESKVRNRDVGEDFVTSYPTDLKIMAAAGIETRMIPDTLAFMDEQIVDALMMPPISKLYNSTEASATVMTDWCRACLITPMQRVIKRVIERQVYQPFLEDMGYSVRVVPTLSFNPPETDVQDKAEFIVQLVQAGIISRQTAAKELGFEEEGLEEEPVEPEQPEEPEQEEPREVEGESWRVTKLNRRGKRSRGS